jgi:hypothetical protein
MDINFEKFKEGLRKEIIVYSFLNKIPITSFAWEERVYNALVFSGIDDKSIIWTPGSHKSGADINIGDKYSFSCKSMITKRNIVRISSFRTTSFKTLEDKIHFIDNKGKNFTHYLVITRTYFKHRLRYAVYMIDANYIQASMYDWKETFGKDSKFTGWKTKFVNGIMLKIKRGLSDQLWISININNFYKDAGIKLLTEVSIENEFISHLWNNYRDGIHVGDK